MPVHHLILKLKRDGNISLWMTKIVNSLCLNPLCNLDIGSFLVLKTDGWTEDGS